MDLLEGKELERQNGQRVSLDTALDGKDILALYFGAEWCPPCRMFVPALCQVYQAAKENNVGLEVIFVSSDETDEDMKHYFTTHQGDWLAIPFDSTISGDLRTRFHVASVPVVVVMARTGAILSTEGKQEVQNFGPEAYKRWVELFKNPPEA